MAERFKVLGDVTRLSIVSALVDHGESVSASWSTCSVQGRPTCRSICGSCMTPAS
ncbi:MAG: hypothetical protein R2710_25695 [Acidimicrobiales bacterium]